MCTYYSIGLLDSLDIANEAVYRNTKHHYYAQPGNIAYGQDMLIVIKYMANHPKELNQHTTEVLNLMRLLIFQKNQLTSNSRYHPGVLCMHNGAFCISENTPTI